MKRKNFIKIIEAIQAQMKLELEFCENLAELIDGSFSGTISSKLIDTIVKALEDELDDHEDPRIGSNISWWLYEHGREVWVNDVCHRLETAWDLFDFVNGEV